MLLGSIDVNDTLSWSPDGESRKGSTKFGVAKKAIILAKYHFLFSSSKEAYVCPRCRKVIIDY